MTTMKKQYMLPTIDVIEIRTTGMLATSITLYEEQVGAGESLAPGMNAEDLVGLPPFVFE